VLNIAVYALTGVWVMLVFRRKRLSVCAIPLYMFLGALTGFFTAAPFGIRKQSCWFPCLSKGMPRSAAVLAAVYQSGQVAMATNISLVWGALLTIVLLIAALSKSTFLL